MGDFLIYRTTALLMLVAASLPATANEELPWSFQNGEAQGYSLAPVWADPTPGTPMCAGTRHTFTVSVTYDLSIRKTGKVVLVFQDEANNQIAGSSGSQVSRLVAQGHGTVTLSEVVVIPKAKEVRVFVPLIPDAMDRTEGELVLRYPIQGCK